MAVEVLSHGDGSGGGGGGNGHGLGGNFCSYLFRIIIKRMIMAEDDKKWRRWEVEKGG